MDDWRSICERLSGMFEANRLMNFDIQLDPEQVDVYLRNKVLFARLDDMDPAKLQAALFVTVDGECGFVASGSSVSTYKFLTNEFRIFVVNLPEGLSDKLWCRIQKDNGIVQRFVKRLGFGLDKETENAQYYTYKGG